MSETERVCIVDADGGDKVLSVVESTAVPGVYGICALNPDGSNLG